LNQNDIDRRDDLFPTLSVQRLSEERRTRSKDTSGYLLTSLANAALLELMV
jgi:hypothetical protein